MQSLLPHSPSWLIYLYSYLWLLIELLLASKLSLAPHENALSDQLFLLESAFCSPLFATILLLPYLHRWLSSLTLLSALSLIYLYLHGFFCGLFLPLGLSSPLIKEHLLLIFLNLFYVHFSKELFPLSLQIQALVSALALVLVRQATLGESLGGASLTTTLLPPLETVKILLLNQLFFLPLSLTLLFFKHRFNRL